MIKKQELRDTIDVLYKRVRELERELFNPRELTPKESWARIIKDSNFLVQNFPNYGEGTRGRINKFEQALELLNDELMKEFAKENEHSKQEG
jgi:hypothetical protein